MTEQDPFNKKHVEEATPSQKKLLDELNLPPKLRSFLEANGKYIIAGLLIVLVMAGAWIFYDYHTAKQKEQASTMLFKAMSQENRSAAQQMMEGVQEEYPGTGSAVWSRVVSAQQQMADKNYGGAVEQYEELISTEGESSPLYPLLEYGIALAYESSEQYDKAIAHYKILQDKPGFVSIAYLGLARNQESLGRIDRARENYQKAGSGEGIPSSVKEFVDYKLATI